MTRAVSFRWMLLPAMGFTLAMIVFPLLYAAWLSLHESSLGSAPTFVGLKNFRDLSRDPEFYNAFKLTWILYALSLAAQLVIGTWLGVFLASNRRCQGIIRAIVVTPFMLPPVVVGMMAIVVFEPTFGIANWLLSSAHIRPQLWLDNPSWVLPTFAAIDTWQWSPFVALLVLGGLQSIPNTVFEAAEIDGVVGWRRFAFVTLPLLVPTLLTAVVLRSVDLLRFFDIIFITTRGGPGNASMTVNVYAYQQGFEFSRYGYGSATMIMLSIVVLCTVLLFAALRRSITW